MDLSISPLSQAIRWAINPPFEYPTIMIPSGSAPWYVMASLIKEVNQETSSTSCPQILQQASVAFQNLWPVALIVPSGLNRRWPFSCILSIKSKNPETPKPELVYPCKATTNGNLWLTLCPPGNSKIAFLEVGPISKIVWLSVYWIVSELRFASNGSSLEIITENIEIKNRITKDIDKRELYFMFGLSIHIFPPFQQRNEDDNTEYGN